MKHICPVCEFDGLYEEPYSEIGGGSYEICPSCGFQFGYDDFPDKEDLITKWRDNWIKNGKPWYSKYRAPEHKDQ